MMASDSMIDGGDSIQSGEAINTIDNFKANYNE